MCCRDRPGDATVLGDIGEDAVLHVGGAQRSGAAGAGSGHGEAQLGGIPCPAAGHAGGRCWVRGTRAFPHSVIDRQVICTASGSLCAVSSCKTGLANKNTRCLMPCMAWIAL